MRTCVSIGNELKVLGRDFGPGSLAINLEKFQKSLKNSNRNFHLECWPTRQKLFFVIFNSSLILSSYFPHSFLVPSHYPAGLHDAFAMLHNPSSSRSASDFATNQNFQIGRWNDDFIFQIHRCSTTTLKFIKILSKTNKKKLKTNFQKVLTYYVHWQHELGRKV